MKSKSPKMIFFFFFHDKPKKKKSFFYTISESYDFGFFFPCIIKLIPHRINYLNTNIKHVNNHITIFTSKCNYPVKINPKYNDKEF